jgi:hypothetical protein
MGDKEVEVPASGDMAVIGEGTPNRTPVSIQVLQNIYHELTGKTEEVSKSYSQAFHVVANDFKQLNHKISQVCEQYNIKAANCSINVFYVNDTKDTFSSFDRFQAFNTGAIAAVESVLFTYNFLIILPRLSEPQSYTVSIRIASPAAIQRKMNEGMFELPKVFKLMGPRTAVVTVKYVDYAVARSMINTIDEWFMALSHSRSGWFMQFMRKHSHYFPALARYFAGVTVVFLVVTHIKDLLPSSPALVDLGKFLIISFSSVFAAYKIAHHLGRAAENSLDNYVDISYICITEGDKNEVKMANSRNMIAKYFGLAKLVSSLLVSVAAKLIVYKLVGTF